MKCKGLDNRMNIALERAEEELDTLKEELSHDGVRGMLALRKFDHCCGRIQALKYCIDIPYHARWE